MASVRTPKIIVAVIAEPVRGSPGPAVVIAVAVVVVVAPVVGIVNEGTPDSRTVVVVAAAR